ncbi:uncharacterized protein LOC143069695 isoform X1 [Mytilus galloprovincialis]|uniref:uncharacterized protein LOC143069695 isoform X1 n=2 Tax=Mytilus galloprovincialis TaxID=29158 RepID=UPI003F7C5192
MSSDSEVKVPGKRAGRPVSLTDSDRKRKKAERNALINKSKIYIGNQYDRWATLKEEIGAKSHAEVAKVLLDRYDGSQWNKAPCYESSASTTVAGPSEQDNSVSEIMESTSNWITTFKEEPADEEPDESDRSWFDQEPARFMEEDVKPDISQISCSNKESDHMLIQLSGMSGMTHLNKADSEYRKQCALEQSKSCINPSDFSIDISGNVDDQISDDDHEVQPSFNITLRPNIVNGSEEQKIEEAENDTTEGNKSEEEAIDMGPGVKRITTKNIDKFISEQPLLVYRDCLLMLANTNTEQICTMSDCNRQVDLKTETIGSAFYITWVCREGHILNKWCSQPILNRRMHCGDLMLASATVSSGSDFQKMELFCKILGLPILNSSAFSKIQKSYIVPSIEEYWLKHLEDIYTEFSRKEIVVLSDSRMDHCTHSCTHSCTYTLMEMETKRILCIVTMDEPTTEGKNTSLEKRCFEKGLKTLTDAGLNIIEVVTNSRPQIRALMKKPQYASIKHSFDIWHGIKNLGKKIIKDSQKRGKENILLLEWTKEIMNHYWHCASVSKNEGEFKGSWFKILHHVVNEHTWLLSYDDSFDNNKCNHGPLSEERENKYMEKGSDAHTALRYIVMDIRLLKDIPYYLNCRSISDLESFQNLISAYNSEPHVYRPDMYRVRNQLAALDHNIHIGRPALTKDNGAPRFQREFNQKSSRWSVQEIKVKKRYPHLSAVVHSILTARLNDDVG